MARNSGSIEQAHPINLTLTVGASKDAGDVVALNDLVVYLQSDSDSDNQAVATIPCRHVQVVEVTAEDHSAGAAISVGDKLYLDTGVINKDNTDGKAFGYALEAVDAGATENIMVGFGL